MGHHTYQACRFLTIFFIILILFTGFNAKSFAQFAEVLVYPDKIELDFTKKNKRFISKVIHVENPTKKTLRIRSYVESWDLNENGSVVFLKGKNERSLKKYIKFNPREFDLAPGQKQLVRLMAKLPANASGEYRSILFFETVNRRSQILQKDKGKIDINVNFKARYGVVLYAYKGQINKNVEVLNLGYEQVEGKPYLIATLKNSGNVHCNVIGDLNISSENKEKKQKLSTYTILPGKTQKFKMAITTKLNNSERYNALLKLNYKDADDRIKVIEAATSFNTEARQEVPLSESLKRNKSKDLPADKGNSARLIQEGKPLNPNELDIKEIKLKY